MSQDEINIVSSKMIDGWQARLSSMGHFCTGVKCTECDFYYTNSNGFTHCFIDQLEDWYIAKGKNIYVKQSKSDSQRGGELDESKSRFELIGEILSGSDSGESEPDEIKEKQHGRNGKV